MFLCCCFLQINFKKVTDKVSKWKIAAEKLKTDLPENDQVLVSWVEQIEDFNKDLPLLQELSLASLKVCLFIVLFL